MRLCARVVCDSKDLLIRRQPILCHDKYDVPGEGGQAFRRSCSLEVLVLGFI